MKATTAEHSVPDRRLGLTLSAPSDLDAQPVHEDAVSPVDLLQMLPTNARISKRLVATMQEMHLEELLKDLTTADAQYDTLHGSFLAMVAQTSSQGCAWCPMPC